MSGSAPSSPTLAVALPASKPDDDADTTFRCLICLDDLPLDEKNRSLSCAHTICTDCLREFWEHQIAKESVAFPGCPMNDCHVHASYRRANELLSPEIMRRVRQLQSLKPARTADGRPLFCVKEGCLEVLPPPPPPPPPTTDGGEEADEAENEATENLITTCPECGTKACIRCGMQEHGESDCLKPLPDERQVRLYRAYAVGRIGSCPRCGTHIVRDGGCQRINCSRCGCSFDFVPFQNVQEAEEASFEINPDEVFQMEENQGRYNQPPGVSIFLMTWGTFFSGVPLAGLVGSMDMSSGSGASQQHQSLGLSRIIFLPFVLIGVPTFIQSVISFGEYIVTNLLPSFGSWDDIPPRRGFGLLLMSVTFAVLAIFLQCTFVQIAGAVGYFYLIPYLVYSIVLFCFTWAHFLVLLARMLIARRRGWETAEEEDAQGSQQPPLVDEENPTPFEDADNVQQPLRAITVNE